MAKASKRALLLSALAIALCIAMLIGTTYAWFTDTATTGVNKIQSGKLKISLIDDDGNSLEGKTIKWNAKDGRDQEKILWEPGATYRTEWFNIRNDGDLALKYKVSVNGFTGDTKLLDMLEFSFLLSGDTVPSSPMVIKSLDEFNNYTGYLLPASEGISTDTITTNPEIVGIRITAKMKEEAGNEYQGLSLDGIGITVVATQYTYEKDSINDQYDKDATYPEYTVTDAAGLTKAAKEGGVITVDNDIDSESAIVANGTVILDMNGKKLENTVDIWTDANGSDGNWSVISVRGGANLTIDGNGTFKAKENDAFTVDVQNGSTVTIKNGTFISNVATVYVVEGTAVIEGGFFDIQQKSSGTTTEQQYRCLLNCYNENLKNGKANIIVKGGTFVNYNPENGDDALGGSFVAEGYKVVSEEQTNGDVWYTVVAK